MELRPELKRMLDKYEEILQLMQPPTVAALSLFVTRRPVRECSGRYNVDDIYDVARRAFVGPQAQLAIHRQYDGHQLHRSAAAIARGNPANRTPHSRTL
jgi:hypothetical protein